MVSNVTPHGVCYDIENSPYTAEWERFMFHFSSPFHRRKFREQVKVKVDWLNDSFSRRFHMGMTMDLVAVLNLYRQIETRGFYVVDVYGRVYRRPEDISIVAELERP